MPGLRRFHRQEQGVAMITAIALLALLVALTVMVLDRGASTSTATARNRSWVQALHVAEAGVQDAIAELQATAGGAAGTYTGTTSEGSFSYTVTALGRNRYRIDSTGSVGSAPSLSASRRLEVVMAPPKSFRFALFSLTDIDTKNNDYITGDIWANTNITVDQGDIVTGSATAATGWVKLRNNSEVQGDVETGGYDTTNGYRAVDLGNGASIGGHVKAASTSPGCVADPGHAYYKVNVDGSIAGSVTTWGEKTGSGPTGTLLTHQCLVAPAPKDIPTFTFNAANYDPATLHILGTPSAPSSTARSDFQSLVASTGSAFHGTYYVHQSGPIGQSDRLDLTGVTFAGDTVIYTNLPIFGHNVEGGANDAVVVVASTYQPPVGSSCDVNHDSSDCAIHFKNNFQAPEAVAVLVYAPNGPVAIKNNQEMFGAVYAGNIQVKNNQVLTYDPRIEQIVGFGEVTLEPESWLELAP
ncbi:MAG: hypothetical protein M5U14_06940 [Acidimicrobiia bacterium]|nr:hypothetical protein [Acidimicrobiia bacterium]